eukprot:NODE_1054_length_619_cov_40.861404_g982_i0.p1 GENE.NODE_1054_length_619_cov_40.861404_g982_i0~~NODE_1054_length_619_cov_40.861404_g982_i0.p1  ORF type:complete len:111 (-),score=11.36 NODE_1054_length_619_cov_40.861404_g982_i0:80-412(-)
MCECAEWNITWYSVTIPQQKLLSENRLILSSFYFWVPAETFFCSSNIFFFFEVFCWFSESLHYSNMFPPLFWSNKQKKQTNQSTPYQGPFQPLPWRKFKNTAFPDVNIVV